MAGERKKVKREVQRQVPRAAPHAPRAGAAAPGRRGEYEVAGRPAGSPGA